MDIGDEIKPRDPFGFACVQLMRKISRMGYQAALEHEVANPGYDDPDYCRMVVALAAGKEHRFPDDPDRTYRCWHCKDVGFELFERTIRGDTRTHGRRCPYCLEVNEPEPEAGADYLL